MKNQNPITPAGGSDLSMTARLITGLKYIVGKGSLQADVVPFGPSQPIQPTFQEEMKGRQFDYQTGYNLTYVPRQNEPITFAQLRALADNYDLLRLAIETRKDQACKVKFRIKPKDPKKKEDSRCTTLDQFFAIPDQEHDWETWLRMILEDLFVIDAVSIFPRMTKGGKLYSLDPMDGALIKRVIDANGRTPVPPDPAYQQYIKGTPAVDYTRDTLIYRPRNMRTNRLYGFSPVEQVIMTVNIAIRRQLHQLQYYTEGSTPDLLFFCPETWNADQIRQFQELWDGLMIGQTAARRQGKFLPNGVQPYDVKQSALKDEYDEWLARIICYAFSLPPTAFVKQMNRATAESSKDQAEEEGLIPIVNWINNLRNFVIWKYFGFTDLESVVDKSVDIDPLVQAEIDKIYLQEYVVSPTDVRDRLGLEGDAPEKPLPPMVGQPTGGPGDAGGNGSGGQPAKMGAKGDKSGGVGDKGAAKIEKVERANKDHEPLDRDRPEINKLREKMQAEVTSFLGAEAVTLADQASGDMNMGFTIDTIMENLDLKGWDVLINPTQEILDAAYKDGVSSAFAQIDFVPEEQAFKLLNEKSLEYGQSRGAELVGMKNSGTVEDPIWIENPDAKWSITDTTRTGLRDTISQAIENGDSPQMLRQSIIDSYGFSPDRAEMIARTELAFADVQGNMAAYEASGVVTGKRWVIASNHDNDDRCDINASAGIIPLGATFPSGVTMPPEHPRCLCDIIPITASQDD